MLACLRPQLLEDEVEHVARDRQSDGRDQDECLAHAEAQHVVPRVLRRQGIGILKVRLARRSKERELFGRGLRDSRARELGHKPIVDSGLAHRVRPSAAATNAVRTRSPSLLRLG
jgi:hypothetical protein